MAYGDRPNKKVEVTDGLALGSLAAALATEDSRGVIVHSEEFDPLKERLKCLLALTRVARIENTLIKLGERDERESQTLRTELLNTTDDLGVAVEKRVHPIGVDEISHRSAIG